MPRSAADRKVKANAYTAMRIERGLDRLSLQSLTGIPFDKVRLLETSGVITRQNLSLWSGYFLKDIADPVLRWSTAFHLNDANGGCTVEGNNSLYVAEQVNQVNIAIGRVQPSK